MCQAPTSPSRGFSGRGQDLQQSVRLATSTIPSRQVQCMKALTTCPRDRALTHGALMAVYGFVYVKYEGI